MDEEKPIFVEAFFKISTQRIQQTLYFYYHDLSKNYFQLMKTGASKGELEAVQANLQQWIDMDDLFINNQKIRMIIQETNLKFQGNNPENPFLIFNILSQPFQFDKQNVNEIHLYAKPEKLPYPAISCWKTLIGTIISVKSNSFSIISRSKTHLTFYLAKGEIIGGDERIFIDPNKRDN
ncbi:MAG: hypothetical protein ACXADY_06040 [Candidatus Hodarchaeales archaeon]|jgi:hypothetical protein